MPFTTRGRHRDRVEYDAYGRQRRQQVGLPHHQAEIKLDSFCVEWSVKPPQLNCQQVGLGDVKQSSKLLSSLCFTLANVPRVQLGFGDVLEVVVQLPDQRRIVGTIHLAAPSCQSYQPWWVRQPKRMPPDVPSGLTPADSILHEIALLIIILRLRLVILTTDTWRVKRCRIIIMAIIIHSRESFRTWYDSSRLRRAPRPSTRSWCWSSLPLSSRHSSHHPH